MRRGCNHSHLPVKDALSMGNRYMTLLFENTEPQWCGWEVHTRTLCAVLRAEED